MTLAAPSADPSEGQAPERRAEPPPGRRRRRLRWPFRIAAIALAVLVVYVGATFAQVWLASHSSPPEPAQAIVVLGAAQYNGTPSPVLEARLRHALDLYQDEMAPLIVVTGGRQQGDRFTEATAGYNWLTARGVPDARILKEVQGRSTWESLAAVARFLRLRHVSDVILVSDATHSLRLRGVGEEVGLDAHVSPAPGSQASGFGRFRSMVRETIAVSAGRIVGYRRLTNLEPRGS